MACPTGIEPVTPSLEGWCSIRLSYGQIVGQILVGVERFELPTSWSQTRRATRLRYTPKSCEFYCARTKRSIAIPFPAFIVGYPAQHDNCFTSLVKVWAQSFKPSTMVR